MSVAYVNKGAWDSGNGAITPGIPSGYTVGNLLLLLVESANEAIGTPSGWNEVSSSPQGTGTPAQAGGVRLAVFWRIATAGQSAPTIADTGNHTTGIIFEFSGANTSNPIYSIAGGVITPGNSTITFPSVSTRAANDMVALCLANDRDYNGSDSLSGWTNANLSSLTQRHDQTVTTGVGGGVGMATGIKATAGSIGSTTVTNGAAVTAAVITICFNSTSAIASAITDTTTHSATITSKAFLTSTINCGCGDVTTQNITYGRLYNWLAVDTGKLAPSGWHIPSQSEFETLRSYIASQAWNYDGTTDVGTVDSNKQGKAIANASGFQYSSVTGAVGNTDYPDKRNISGFSAFPSGYRSVQLNGFSNPNSYAYWWSATAYDSGTAYAKYASYGFAHFNQLVTNKKDGFAIRCVRTTYANWQNDLPFLDIEGNEYTAIEFGTQLWMVQNLATTKYNDNTDIPNITDETEWENATSGAYCDLNNDSDYVFSITTTYGIVATLQGGIELASTINSSSTLSATLIKSGKMYSDVFSGTSIIKDIKYGYLYNWWAASDTRNIANYGWHVPNLNEYWDLMRHIDPDGTVSNNTANNELREIGTLYWYMSGGLNSEKFNGRGSGLRDYSAGTFNSLREYCSLWMGVELSSDYAWCPQLNSTVDSFATVYYNGNNFTGSLAYKKEGASIRLVKDSTNLSDGEEGIYTGNDGTVYKTICINNQEFLADSLVETKYRNGDDIPNITVDSDWIALTSGAYCAYDNINSNAFTQLLLGKVQGTLLGDGSLSSAINTSSSLLATLTGKKNISSTIESGTIDSGATLEATGDLLSTINSATSINATIQGLSESNLAITINESTTQSATLTAKGELESTINTSSLTTSALNAKGSLAATILEGTVLFDIVYGLLYNHYALTYNEGGASIAPAGWHVPTEAEIETLVGGTDDYWMAWGEPFKSRKKWLSLNGSGSSGLDIYPAGKRTETDGTFNGLTTKAYVWCYDAWDATRWFLFDLMDTDNWLEVGAEIRILGCSVRLIKDDSNDPGTVTDYDGNVYRTVKIGDQVWTSQNLIVRHYNNGVSIPNITSNSEWINLTSGAWAAYDNDESNIYGFIDQVFGTLDAKGTLQATINTSSVVSGELELPSGALSANINSVTTITATLTGTGSMSSTINTSSMPSIVLTGKAEMSATINTTSTLTATLTGKAELSITINTSSTVSATLHGHGGLSATIDCQTLEDIILTADGELVSVITGETLDLITLMGWGKLEANINTSSQVVGTISEKAAFLPQIIFIN